MGIEVGTIACDLGYPRGAASEVCSSLRLLECRGVCFWESRGEICTPGHEQSELIKKPNQNRTTTKQNASKQTKPKTLWILGFPMPTQVLKGTCWPPRSVRSRTWGRTECWKGAAGSRKLCSGLWTSASCITPFDLSFSLGPFYWPVSSFPFQSPAREVWGRGATSCSWTKQNCLGQLEDDLILKTGLLGHLLNQPKACAATHWRRFSLLPVFLKEGIQPGHSLGRILFIESRARCILERDWSRLCPRRSGRPIWLCLGSSKRFLTVPLSSNGSIVFLPLSTTLVHLTVPYML